MQYLGTKLRQFREVPGVCFERIKPMPGEIIEMLQNAMVSW